MKNNLFVFMPEIIYSLIAILAFLVFILLFFRKNIQDISLKNTPIGDFLVTLNQEKKILDPKNEKLVGRTSAEEIWALNDLSKKKENGYIKSLNPIQKYVYYEMSQDNLVKKEGDYIILTDLGKSVLALARLIDL